MKRPKPELIRRQRTIFYPSSGRDRQGTEFYTHMFIEDVSLAIMPIGGRSQRPGFNVIISPANRNIEVLVRDGLHSAHESSGFAHSLADAVYELFYPLAAMLCRHDRVTYEIVYLEDSDNGKPVAFELARVNSSQIINDGGRLFQKVPRPIAVEQNVPEMIPLEPDALVTFELPAEYVAPLRTVRLNLAELDTLHFSQIMIRASEDNKLPYDFKVHEHAQHLALVESLREIGWNARGTFNKSATSYYWILLLLRFEQFKIALRQTLLQTLNSALVVIGNKLGFTAQIEIVGLPTMDDITTAHRNLDSGDMAFTEATKPFDN